MGNSFSDMKLLPNTAPEVHQGFQNGECGTKETKNVFNQIADDQALEHVNKSSKVAGGLEGNNMDSLQGIVGA